MSPDEARRFAELITAAVAEAPSAGTDVADQLEHAAGRVAPDLVGSPALAAAGQLYKIVVDPRRGRGWEMVDLGVLQDVLYRALVQDPGDPLWRDYQAHLAAVEAARPRLNPVLDPLLRRRPSVPPQRLDAVRESTEALRAHRRSG